MLVRLAPSSSRSTSPLLAACRRAGLDVGPFVAALEYATGREAYVVRAGLAGILVRTGK